jgi:hypothetical protein
MRLHIVYPAVACELHKLEENVGQSILVIPLIFTHTQSGVTPCTLVQTKAYVDCKMNYAKKS